MTRKHWLNLGPSLLVGTGIIVSTFIASLAAESGWLVLAGPLLLVLALVGADMLNSRLRGESPVPSWPALTLGGAFLLASSIVILRDPNLVRIFIPLIGAAAWVTLVLRPDSRCKTCRASNVSQ